MIEYQTTLSQYDPQDLMFLDESGAVCNLALLYGYAPKGQRAYDTGPVAKGKRVSTIGVISQQGLLTSMCFEGTLIGSVFEYFIKNFLVDHLTPGKALVLDNASVHKNEAILKFIESKGVEVIFLPPYSPDQNPIEFCWSKAKRVIKKIRPRNLEELYEAWGSALKIMDGKLASSCFKHCGLK